MDFVRITKNSILGKYQRVILFKIAVLISVDLVVAFEKQTCCWTQTPFKTHEERRNLSLHNAIKVTNNKNKNLLQNLNFQTKIF